ncbi:MAG: DUF4170 domain-containing protein [Phenylobacterium sp.]|uniref:DUF4170 domain-containing protein n=1 Tax=Phenylobacterium sp. TaxID=1871053 RepID=UPI001A51BCAA|nr:DUF4170 domain-containing protein [Phenylobacterium sp.]MBL8772116.1 DUF4170 domain-containing protein [Phenylobacterium sp.]
MPHRQLLHLVIGGELKDLDGPPEFKDPGQIDFVGGFASYDEAVRAWRAKAQQTVDNALMRYFVLHAHKLLTPGSDDDEH